MLRRRVCAIIFRVDRQDYSVCMLDKIRAKRDELYAIARRHKAERLWVFGSCARREERPDSDVDILVKFGDGPSSTYVTTRAV